MNDTCRLLSNGYKFQTTFENELIYTPCCVWTGPILPVNATPSEHKNYRKMLNSIDSYKSKFCESCNYHNSNSIRKSWREQSFEIIPNSANLGDASYIEVQIDKTCNGGCIICDPTNSSYLSNELFGPTITIHNKLNHIDNILNLIDIDTVKKILFVGGEPFLSKIDLIFFESIKNPQDLQIQYTTNGSIYPSEKKIAYWKNFKNVIINFSIDAVGEKFNYIRYPLNWEKVEANILRMKEELPLNITFKINHTVNILNLYYYDEFLNWYNCVFLAGMKHNVIPFTFNPAYGGLTPRYINRRLFDAVCLKYPLDSVVCRTITDVNDQDFNIPYPIVENDARRTVNWKTVFPEIVKCFD